MNAQTENNINDNSKIHCYLHPEAHLIDDYDSGDIVCPLCGLVVVDRVIDIFIDSRHYSHDDQRFVRSCVGSPENYLLRSYSNLSTSIMPRQGENVTETEHLAGFYFQYQINEFYFGRHAHTHTIIIIMYFDCVYRTRIKIFAIKIIQCGRSLSYAWF